MSTPIPSANLARPRNQNAEVLYELLFSARLSRIDFLSRTGILNVTARIANLRINHNIVIQCDRRKVKNKHGRPVSYGVWSIPANKRYDAWKAYDKVNS